jgi:hypothetical protein
MPNTNKTDAQRQRQAARDKSGKYNTLNRCEVCAKSAGAKYYSYARAVSTSTGQRASVLVVCSRCVDALVAQHGEDDGSVI